MTTAFVITFVILLCSGFPIFLTLGLTSMIMLAFFSPTPVIMVPEIMYNSLGGFTLLAIPFFTIAAQFMVKGGTSSYLIRLANCLVGHWWGGLAIVCSLTGLFFGAICGSSVASAMALGLIIVPEMMDKGYSRSFATGVVAASGTMAIMIPPSITLILYGIITEQSIPRLFLGGVFPGILEATLYIIWIHLYSKKKKFRGGEKATPKETIHATIRAAPALTLPVIVLGGIYSGIVTVTEAAALAAGTSMVIAVFIYREVKLRDILPVTFVGMKSAGMIMIIIATASVFGHWITHAGIPADIVTFVRDFALPAHGFLLCVAILLIVLGMFLEVASILLITLPILFPVVLELGIDPIHFGVFMVANMEMALITPPVGLNLYVLSGATDTPLKEVMNGAFPFMIIGLILVVFYIYCPQFILFLPSVLMPQ